MSSQIRVLSFEFGVRSVRKFLGLSLRNWCTKTLNTLHSTLILFLLAGCGFQPVYGTSSGLEARSPIRMGVKVSAVASGAATASNNTSIDDGYSASMSRQFVHNLEDMLAFEGSPTYKLDVIMTQSSVGLGVARDGTASRYNLVINSNYKLIRIADGKQVDSGTISNVTSYNNPNNQYFSTYISEQDARKSGIKELAEIYRQRLLSYTEKKPEPVVPNNLSEEKTR